VPEPAVQSAIDAEAIAQEAESVEGFTVSILRCGYFYDSESAHIRMFADALRKRQLPIMGGGDALWAMIHTDDAASAYLAAAEKPVSGIWHVVDDELVQVRVFLNEFAVRLRAPAPRRVPIWLAKWLAGEQVADYFTKSTRTTNALFRSNFDWTLRYHSFREGLDQIAASWNDEAAHRTVV
jgi:nucleoside-diphosphate-sugar epimerase